MSSQPFAGIQVVEFGQFIAVPYCAQLLAAGGANVMKVEPLEGDPVRHLSPLTPGETRHFISRNRGKHSLPLDLKHPLADRVLDALLSRADVVLTNMRPGLATSLGLDYTALSRRFPRIITGNVTAFGREGPDAGLAGMDLVVQARSGLMAANGRLRDGLPAAGDPPIIDYMCAMSLAFGISSALYRRERTGLGGEVEVNLLMAGMALQTNFVQRVDSVDGPVFAEALDHLTEARSRGAPFSEQAATLPAGRANYMSSVYYRTYATKDSFVAVACASPSLQRAFTRAVGFVDVAHGGGVPRDELPRHYAALQLEAEGLLRSRPTAEWKRIFGEHGVPVSDVKFPIELLDDPQVTANGMVYDLPHPSLGTVRVLANPVELDDGAFQTVGPTAPFGSESRTLLAGLGFAQEEVAQFLSEGLTHEGLSAG
jgi:crotonobetainyl-CoA:carnitine CoA-transferase CaiB-like acyl-CoA transferase